MLKSHLTTDTLLALADAEASLADAAKAAAHLALCGLCRGLLGRLPEELAPVVRQRLATADPSKRVSVLDYRSVYQRVVSKCSEEDARIEEDRIGAYQLLEELERYSVARRRILVANVDRFQSLALAELLLERSRQSRTGDPHMSEVRAVLACDISRALQAEGYQELLLNDVRAEAWSYVANSLRIRGCLEEAEKAFLVAEGFLDCGSGDLLDRAQLLDLRVSLWRDLGQLEEAFAALDLVIGCRESLGDRHLVGRGLVSKALLLESQHRLEEAVSLLREAEPLLDCSRDPVLELYRRKNLVSNLLALGRIGDAQSLMPRLKELSRRFGDRLDRLRVLRIEGQLLYASGQRALGEELLRSVHESFLKAGVAHLAASVALDLAEIYHDQGRVPEVRVLTERVKAYALLACNEAEQEAVAALIGLHPPTEDVLVIRSLLGQIAHRLSSLLSPRSFLDGEF